MWNFTSDPETRPVTVHVYDGSESRTPVPLNSVAVAEIGVIVSIIYFVR